MWNVFNIQGGSPEYESSVLQIISKISHFPYEYAVRTSTLVTYYEELLLLPHNHMAVCSSTNILHGPSWYIADPHFPSQKYAHAHCRLAVKSELLRMLLKEHIIKNMRRGRVLVMQHQDKGRNDLLPRKGSIYQPL